MSYRHTTWHDMPRMHIPCRQPQHALSGSNCVLFCAAQHYALRLLCCLTGRKTEFGSACRSCQWMRQYAILGLSRQSRGEVGPCLGVAILWPCAAGGVAAAVACAADCMQWCHCHYGEPSQASPCPGARARGHASAAVSYHNPMAMRDGELGCGRGMRRVCT